MFELDGGQKGGTQLDYLRQLNAFENWLEYNELGAGPQLLWYKLMVIANRSGWQSELSIANTRLQAMTKTSEKTLINNRNQLIQNGLLQYKKRGRTKAGVYIITDLTGNYSVKTTVESPSAGNITVDSKVNQKVKREVNHSVDSTVNSSAYINNTKQNNNISPTTPKMAKSAELESDFEKLWNLYPRKERKADAFKAYKKAIKAGTTNKEIQDGIVAYTRSVANTDKQYIAQGGTWFNQQRWQDVVDEPVHHAQGFQDNYDEVMKAYEQ